MTPRWGAALAFALTGVELPLPASSHPDVPSLVHGLAEAGWDAERVGEHARTTLAGGGTWPHPVPPDLRTGCGAAQFAAALGAVRALLGLTALETRPPSPRRRLDRDEERLMREVPPHHGS